MGCEHHSHCSTKGNESTPSRPWFAQATSLVILISIVLLSVAFSVPALHDFAIVFRMYLATMALPVLLGLLIGGIIDYYIPREFISYWLASPKKRTVLYSVFFGFLMSVCSHGILAIAVQIHKKGASTASVVAFLLASPWANLPLTLLLVGFFGWARALSVVLGAIVIAVITGYIFRWLEARRWVESQAFEHTEECKSPRMLRSVSFLSHPTLDQAPKDIAGVLAGAWSLSNMVLGWILFGALAASLLSAYVPPDLFKTYMGPSLPGLFFTLIVATVVEVCSEGMAPLAFEIYRNTHALGNAFVFLMAGVVTDYTEIGLLWKNIGRKTAILLPLITVPQVLLLGFVMNLFFQ